MFSPGDRFPLGPPRGFMANCLEGPSGPGTRPFSLRHVVPGARLDEAPALDWTYCHDRQLAMVRNADGSLSPYHESKHTKPGPTPGLTSGRPPGGDGQGPTPEEVGDPDHDED